MNPSEKAAEYMAKGFNCAQSVFTTFAETFNLDEQTALKLAAPLGGGIGRTGETCGAVSGGLMALGLVIGNTSGDKEAKDRTYLLAQEFLNRFKEQDGSTRCKELLGFDISTPEGLQQARERSTHSTVCTGLVMRAAALAAEMMEREQKK